jgi:hypothetical protein
MDIGGWTLVAWVGVALAMLLFLKVCLSRLCALSCEELSCVRNRACEKGDV